MPTLPRTAIVVACVESKSHPPLVSIAKDLSGAKTPSLRLTRWTRKLDAAATRHPLLFLYKGVAWSSVRAMHTSGHQLVDIWVASAGLGLMPVETDAPAYGATFTLGHPDSIGRSKTDLPVWWNALGDWHPAWIAKRLPRQIVKLHRRYDEIVVALPSLYLTAVAEDLCAKPEKVVVCGLGSLPPLSSKVASVVIPAGIRQEVGGTLTSALNRTVAEAIRRVGLRKKARTISSELRQIAAEAPQLEVPKRTIASDEWIRRFIREVLAKESGLSSTAALARLRRTGYACEQSRFHGLYRHVRSENQPNVTNG